MRAEAKKKTFPYVLLGLLLAACGGNPGVDESARLVVVNSPATGEVRRVLVAEKVAITGDAPIIEIVVRTPVATAENRTVSPTPGPNPRDLLAEARREVERTTVEVSRVERLVASKEAPQSQLDAAQADFQRAYERLQQLQKNAKNTPPADQRVGDRPAGGFDEKIVLVRAPAPGVVRVVSVKRGQTVTAGQPLATISAND